MSISLNPGFTNNINILVVRASATSLQKLTDRPIDIDGDGNVEAISIVHVSGDAASGDKHKVNTVTTPRGFRNTIVDQPIETDGGVHTDDHANEFTEGVD